MNIQKLSCINSNPTVNKKNSINFTSNPNTVAHQIEQKLLKKGIQSEFLNNSFVAECTQRSVEIFEKLFGNRLLSKSINFQPIEASAYGDCRWNDCSIRINSELDCYESKESLTAEMKKSKNIFFLPDEKSTTHYLSTFCMKWGMQLILNT